jgi:hypothetical protein
MLLQLQSMWILFIFLLRIFRNPVALIFHSLISFDICKHTFHFIHNLIIFPIKRYYFKMSFIDTCFAVKRSSSGSNWFEEITTMHGLKPQHFHAVTACRRILQIHARSSLIFKHVLLKFIFVMQCNNFLLQFMYL